MAKADLTAARLRELLDYNPDTGVFTWRSDRRCGQYASVIVVKAGDRAGCVAKDGRALITIDGKRHRSHRLAWLYTHGVWPTYQIDHINGDNRDNRIGNLRDVTHATNMENVRKPMPFSKSGLIGATWHGPSGLWVARVSVKNKQVSFGCYKTAEEAHQAYLVAKRRLHEGCTI